MSNRPATSVALLIAGLLAGTSLAAAEDAASPSATRTSATRTADNCLSGPKGVAPAGGHWYYRLERTTKRKCWYVGEDKTRVARAAPQEAPPPATVAAATPAPQLAPAPVSKSVADAHAEWTTPSNPTRDATGMVRPVTPDAAPPSAVGARWADSAEMGAANHSRLAAAELAGSLQANAGGGATREPATSTPAVAPSAPPLKNASNSTQMLLIVMASALAFSVLVASLVFRFTGKPAAADELPDAAAPAPWDAEQLRGPSAPRFVQFLQDAPAPRHAEAGQDDRAPGETERQIAAMLTRLARSATA